MTMRPDPTFHASPKLAMQAPPEDFAYTLLLSPDFSKPDALAVIDVKPDSPTYSQIVHTVVMPYKGDEFHHFGWNACSSALSPLTGHAFLERRYLIIPGIRSSRIYVIDTKPHPTQAKIHKIIEPEELFRKTGYSRPHTVHCGPEGIYISTLGGAGKNGTDGPPGVFIMDCETFDIIGRWEIDRGPQKLHYDFWWNLPRDYMVSSEWGLPPQFENGIVPEDLLSNKYGHSIHFWDLRARRNVQTIDLGANHQMALEVRPAHDPVREYGFLGVVVDTTNLEGSIWTWWREGGKFHIEKTATIPPEPAAKDQLPPLLQGFGAVPPLISDIDLSLDDKFLYVACWGTGEMRQYDVTDPRKPKLSGSVHIGGIARRTPHSNGKIFAGGPQMVEISRDGKRVYWTNSLYSTWDDQFYPGGVPGAEVMANAGPNGGLELAKRLLGEFPRRLPGAPDPARRRRLLDGFVLLPVGLKVSAVEQPAIWLWLAVIASGLYHGINPGMGWPLAVSAGLMEKSARALVAALWPLTIGHLLAMLVIILPFSLLITLAYWQRQIQIAASLMLIGFGLVRFANRRHPRALARIRPTQLGLWSFAVAIAHGAGLMLVPIYLGLCRASELDGGHFAASTLIGANIGMAVLVSVVHSLAMITAGGVAAWLVYRHLGLKFVSRSWFNLDGVWAVSLMVVGTISLAINVAG